MALKRCPDCGARVAADRLSRHREKVHGSEPEVRSRQRARAEERREEREAGKTMTRLPPQLPWIVFVILAFVGVVYLASYVGQNYQTPPPGPECTDTGKRIDECVEHAGLGIHWHSTLKIVIDGKQVEVPANIGITPSCMKPLHTHDATGVIHIEYSRAECFTLGEFFEVWGQTFSKDEILGYKAGNGKSIAMTVNGASSEAFGSLLLQDGQSIVVTYG